MRTVYYTNQFKKDYKRLKKRNLNLENLNRVLDQLVRGIPLSENYHNHPLRGIFRGYRECHVEPDWLLIYKVEFETLILFRTGTHADLFD